MRKLIVGFTLAFAFAAAGCDRDVQPLKDPCVEDPALCPACSSAADCKIVSNPCHEFAYCVHRDSNFAVTLEGCPEDAQRSAPSSDACGCVDTLCRGVR